MELQQDQRKRFLIEKTTWSAADAYRSSLSVYLATNYQSLSKGLEGLAISFTALATALAAEGVTDAKGAAPSEVAVRKAWSRAKQAHEGAGHRPRQPSMVSREDFAAQVDEVAAFPGKDRTSGDTDKVQGSAAEAAPPVSDSLSIIVERLMAVMSAQEFRNSQVMAAAEASLNATTAAVDRMTSEIDRVLNSDFVKINERLRDVSKIVIGLSGTVDAEKLKVRTLAAIVKRPRETDDT